MLYQLNKLWRKYWFTNKVQFWLIILYNLHFLFLAGQWFLSLMAFSTTKNQIINFYVKLFVFSPYDCAISLFSSISTGIQLQFDRYLSLNLKKIGKFMAQCFLICLRDFSIFITTSKFWSNSYKIETGVMV